MVFQYSSQAWRFRSRRPIRGVIALPYSYSNKPETTSPAPEMIGPLNGSQLSR